MEWSIQQACTNRSRAWPQFAWDFLSQRKNEVAVIIQFWRHVLLQILDKVNQLWYTEPVRLVGVDDGEVPPVPIPNTEVKLTFAEDS